MPAAEIHALLRMIRGIESVEVQTGPDGAIESIDITVRPDEPPRRVIRDVESALMSGLGLTVDHRVIRVDAGASGKGNGGGRASGGNGLLPAQFLQENIAGASGGPIAERARLLSVTVEPDGELYCQVTVELEADGQRYRGSSREADTRRARLLATGRATIDALVRSLERETAVALEGIEEFEIGDEPAVIARIQARRGRESRAFMGAALQEGRPHHATARAVLDALNRFWAAEDHAAA